MIKNVWDMTPDDIALINGKYYRHNRDFRQRRPNIGIVLVRELIDINYPNHVSRFIYGMNVEVIGKQKATAELEEK